MAMPQRDEKMIVAAFAMVAAVVVAVLSGYGAKEAAAAVQGAAGQPKTGIGAMTDEDRVYYANSFTTLATVPYGRCWPGSLFSILSAGRAQKQKSRLLKFTVPTRFKQNEGYSEWLRVKSVTVDCETRRVVAATGCVGPFADDTAVQRYLNTEVRPELNSSIIVVRNDTEGTSGEMRFLCESKHGGFYALRISLRESNGKLWLESVAETIN